MSKLLIQLSLDVFDVRVAALASDGGRMKSSDYGVFRRGPDGHTGGPDQERGA